MKGERQNCFGDCGKQILLFYNPSGYCRKCQRKNRHKAQKLDAKKEREQKNNVQD